MRIKNLAVCILLLISQTVVSQKIDQYKPDFNGSVQIPGMNLVWHDEFNITGKPNSANWTYESGFVRNQELQWYQPDNANCKDGVLVIEGRRQKRINPDYIDSSPNWRSNREYAWYTSSSLKTQGLQQWQYGRLEVRARIDTSAGSWPAIWTLGIRGRWPLNGEVDIMEFYRIRDTATILANLAWGRSETGSAFWSTKTFPLAGFMNKDRDWNKKFHVWAMEWNKDDISIFLDGRLLNKTLLDQTLNPDGTNPFLQPHYLLLNLAIGANGGDPSNTRFPVKYEVDYVRYYKKVE